MIEQKYLFSRDPRSLQGFHSTNSVSTDALNALAKWASINNAWSYQEVEDRGDNGLVAILSVPESDKVSAGVKLHDACIEYGLVRDADAIEKENA